MSKKVFDPTVIKHILFDLGGVLLNIDYKLTEDAFKSIGFVDFDLHYSQFKQEGLFDDFEKGLISRDYFIDSLIQKSEQGINPFEIENAWNAMLLDFPHERLEMLLSLKNTYNIFLLSNTNEIHYEAFNKIFNETFNSSFSSYFQKDYYSHLMGERKPDAQIFRTIMHEQGLEAKHLLFIDDSEQHIKSAAQLGIETLYLEKGKDVADLLGKIGILT